MGAAALPATAPLLSPLALTADLVPSLGQLLHEDAQAEWKPEQQFPGRTDLKPWPFWDVLSLTQPSCLHAGLTKLPFPVEITGKEVIKDVFPANRLGQ